MNAVIISNKPKDCELIANGKKTIMVKKTRPKTEPPFKCYIYCTYGKGLIEYYDYFLSNCLLDETVSKSNIWGNCCNGKVIGDFICDEINEFKVFENGTVQNWNYYNLEDSCLTYDELANYIGFGKYGYTWHMSDIKIYYEPKKLREFRTPPCAKGEKACENCKNIIDINTPNGHERECYVDDGKTITRPPQSWQYCEIKTNTKGE